LIAYAKVCCIQRGLTAEEGQSFSLPADKSLISLLKPRKENNMRTKMFYTVCLLVITSMLLAACSGGATPVPTEAPTPEPVPTDTPKSEVVEIHWFYGGNITSEQADPLIEKFNASQNKIKLVADVIANQPLKTLSTQVASGSSSDIVGPIDWGTSNWIYYGQWLDLAPLIKESGYDTNQFSKTLMASLQTEAGLIGLPFDVTPSLLIYQKGMFDKAGLNYPPAKYGEKYVMPDGAEKEWSFDTLAEVARLLTLDANGKNATQDGFDRNTIVQYGFYPMYQATTDFPLLFGPGRLVGADNKTVQIPEDWKTAWKWSYDGMMGPQPFIPTNPVAGTPEFGEYNTFNSGKVAMATMYFWFVVLLPDAGQNWDLAAQPSYNGKVNGYLNADVFHIWKGTQHPKEAFEVLTFLTSGPSSLEVSGPGFSARTADQEASFARNAEQLPWVTNWDVVKAGLDFPVTPLIANHVPDPWQATKRLVWFDIGLSENVGVPFDTAIADLQTFLQFVFNQ
jgi:multiple sugar transport system substrate-binding protein